MYVYCQPSKTMTAFVSQVVNEGSRSYFYTITVDRGQRISPHRYAFVTKKIAKNRVSFNNPYRGDPVW